MVVASSGELFDRILSPEGDPDTLQRLAWHRSALRLNILLTYHREQPGNELSYLLSQLEILPPEVRHRVLAAPETALYVNALVNNRVPSAHIAVPLLSRLFLASPASASHEFSWSGELPLNYLPLGPHVLRMPGIKIKDPQLLFDDQCIKLSSTSGGTTITLPFEVNEEISENWSVRADNLEIVDGWEPFCDDFDDGNMSINLDRSARGTLEGILQEATTLIETALPSALEEMLETAQYLSPIRPKDTHTLELPSFSSPALPGVIFIGIQQGNGAWTDARHLAESCVHEHLHNRLYILDETMSLTIHTAEPQLYFSPWKRTMRGIDGMLHAIYVFSHLAWFWRRVGAKLPELQQYADRCVEEQVEHLESAAGTLDTDELTEAGRCVLQASTKILQTLTANC
jgi:HEXXH motif-containing protein